MQRLLAFSQVRSSGHDDALRQLDALGPGTPLFEEGRAALREVLPEVMVPSRVVVLPEMLLTPNRKIDRKTLARMDLPAR